MNVERRIWDGSAVVSEYVATSLYGLTHPAWWRSGATVQEERMPVPGDELVNNPSWTATRATTVATPPGAVWPWIARMGYGDTSGWL